MRNMTKAEQQEGSPVQKGSGTPHRRGTSEKSYLDSSNRKKAPSEKHDNEKRSMIVQVREKKIWGKEEHGQNQR